MVTVAGLTMNGTNYVSTERVDTEAWPTVFKLTAVAEDGTVVELLDHAKLLQQEQYAWDGGRFYLAFASVDAQEVENARLRAQIDYLAMMADVDLDV